MPNEQAQRLWRNELQLAANDYSAARYHRDQMIAWCVRNCMSVRAVAEATGMSWSKVAWIAKKSR